MNALGLLRASPQAGGDKKLVESDEPDGNTSLGRPGFRLVGFDEIMAGIAERDEIAEGMRAATSA